MSALVMVVVPLLSVSASAKESECPRIRVHGFMGSDIYDDPSDPDSPLSWPPSGEEILTAVKESVPALAEFAITRDWDKLGCSLGDIAGKVFSRATNNPDGTVKDGSGVRFEYPDAETLTAESDIYFEYDWREDPIDIAAELNDFIDYVLDATGSEQVALTCHSFGGVVATTYFTLYGCEKVKTVVFNSTAIYGETYTGELMTGQLYFSGKSLADYLEFAFQGTDGECILDAAVKILEKSGVLDVATDLVNSITGKIQVQVCARSVVPLFGGWLAIWSMIPDEYLDEATDYVFNTVYAESENDYSALRAKIENYNNLVRSKKDETLKKVNEECNVYVITRYGYSSIPITPSADNLGDGTIDVKYASFGATASKYGSTLENITADEKYISPDRTVDASTCMFPEQTWFVKNMKHGADEEALDEMMRTFMKYDGQATVDTFPEYPRFTVFDGESIVPETVNESLPAWSEKLLLVINYIFNLVKMLVAQIG